MEKVQASNPTMFGTPPEPLFNNAKHGASAGLMQEWLQGLLIKNAKAIKSARPSQHAGLVKDSVEFLFLTCEQMKMSSEVKYLSLEIFDRFMIQHVEDLYEHVANTGDVKTRGKEWNEIKKRVTNQVVLRVVSCIQIASKLTSHYRILSPNKAKRFLIEAGHRYSNESILQSELRILKTLNFHVSEPSPLVFLECLLEALGSADTDVDVKVLQGVCLKLLDMVYLQHDEVFDKLHRVTVNGHPISVKERDSFASVRADKVLLMSTLITSAAYIIDRDNHEKTMMVLSRLTNIPAEDMADFASVILQTLMESSED